MATSNNDRISSAKLATFATKLWDKIKSTFVRKSGDTMTGNLEVKRTNATSEVRTYNTATNAHFTIGYANGADGAQRGLYDSKIGTWVFRIPAGDKEIELNRRVRVDTVLDVKRSSASSETDMRVFKPGNVDNDSHPHLNLYYGVNNVRGIWDSVKNVDVLEIKADNSVVLHGSANQWGGYSLVMGADVATGGTAIFFA